MRPISFLLLSCVFASLGTGLLLFTGEEVDGVFLPATGVVAVGVASLILWSRVAGQHGDRSASRSVRESPVARGHLTVRAALGGAAAAIIAVGVAQARSGQVYHRGFKRAIDAPATAWLLGGSMILVGLGLAVALLLRAAQPDV